MYIYKHIYVYSPPVHSKASRPSCCRSLIVCKSFCNPSKISHINCAHTLAKGKTKIKIMAGSAERGAPCQVPSLPVHRPRASLIGWMDECRATLGQPLVGIMIKWTHSLARPFNSPRRRRPDLHCHQQYRTHGRCSHLWKLDCVCVRIYA